MPPRRFLLATVLLVTGCAGPAIYQDATGPMTSKLRLRMEEPIVSNLNVVAIDVETCSATAAFAWVTGGLDSLYAKRVGMLDSKPPAEGILEYVVPAGKPLAARTALHVAKLNAGQIFLATVPAAHDWIRSLQPAGCPAPAFLPRPGQQYEIVYKAGPGTCTTRIYQMRGGPQGVERIDITDDMNLVVEELGSGKFICRAP